MNTPEWTDQQEIDSYIQSLHAYINGTLTEESFKVLRLQHGIYGQRQENEFMVRIKIPAGVLSKQQLRVLAYLLDNYSKIEFANVTTRQDIQLHFVELRDTSAIMRQLAKVNLTTREACGNTVRNITSCSLAGVCPNEHVDVREYVYKTAQHFLRHDLTQHLPRKLKMSFSGCKVDCAQGGLHDVAVIAVKNEHDFGFKILAGGGLGHKPHEAIVIEPFVKEQELILCLEAVIQLHNRYSNRKKRARSRIKFLVDRFGESGFIEHYQIEKQRIQDTFNQDPLDNVSWRDGESFPVEAISPKVVFPQKQQARFVVPVHLQCGDISAEQLRAFAEIMELESLSDCRTTQDQNILLTGIPTARISSIKKYLHAFNLNLPGDANDVVTCPGTWTCRLGITNSRIMAQKLSQINPNIKVRVSGCHNGCGQPYVGDVGLHGEGRRIHGHLIPHYRIHLGGSGQQGEKFALAGPEIPARRAVQAVRHILSAFKESNTNGDSFKNWVQQKGSDYFEQLLNRFITINENEAAQLAQDLGENEIFRVFNFGGGECAGVNQETVAALIAEARHEKHYLSAFIAQNMFEQASDCALHILALTAKALLLHRKIELKNQNCEIAELENYMQRVPDFSRLYSELYGSLLLARHTVSATLIKSANSKLNQWTSNVVLEITRQSETANLQIDFDPTQAEGQNA